MKRKPNKWYCYICGTDIYEQFTLCAMSDRTDRVFLAHTTCAVQFDDPMYVLHILSSKKDDSKGLTIRG